MRDTKLMPSKWEMPKTSPYWTDHIHCLGDFIVDVDLKVDAPTLDFLLDVEGA